MIKIKKLLKKSGKALAIWIKSAGSNKLALMNTGLSLLILWKLQWIDMLVNTVGEAVISSYVSLSQNDGVIFSAVAQILSIFADKKS